MTTIDALTVPGTLRSVRTIGRYVQAAAEEAGLEKQAAYRLRQAVDEIATNAVIHGYEPHGCEGDLTVVARLGKRKLTITLLDDGPDFDPLSVPPPADLEWRTADRPAGGLGVYLALSCVDEFQHDRVNDQNKNIFVQRVRK